MRTTIFISLIVLTFIWSGMVLGSEPMRLTVGGTGSGLGFMRLLGDGYSALHPEVTVKVLPSLGSTGGIRALHAGAIDLAVSSRQLKEQEKAGLKGFFLGVSPFVFVVHPSTAVEDVTPAEVVNIYNGTISAWPDGNHIRRILRPNTDSDWLLLHGLSPELAKALDIAEETKGLYLAVTDTETISYLERIPGSFGPSTLTMILAEKRNVKILSFSGIQPEVAEHGKEKYPLVKPYYLLARSEASAPVESFIEFIGSEQGRRILTQVRVMPDSEIPIP
ncbi:MAG: substrate-binding domain-containing protein [Pseudomonadota bacterium]